MLLKNNKKVIFDLNDFLLNVFIGVFINTKLLLDDMNNNFLSWQLDC